MSNHLKMVASSALVIMLIGLPIALGQIQIPVGSGSHGESGQKLGPSTNATDLDIAASDQSSFTTNSHKILASGWPATSPMWPSIDTIDGAQPAINQTRLTNTVEPFIYADKPRDNDYSLLLNINKTIADELKSRSKPMAVNLSFEYYFSFDTKITALPGIKIEVDRKEFRYLEPSSAAIKPRIWIKFNEQIMVTDPSQFDNHDWLKFSLVNRRSPSLVAIRHLRVEFLTGEQSSGKSTSPSSTSSQLQQVSNVPAQSQSPAPVDPQQQVPLSPPIQQAAVIPLQQPASSTVPQSSYEGPPATASIPQQQVPYEQPSRPQQLPPVESNQLTPGVPDAEQNQPPQEPVAPGGQQLYDQQSAASSVVSTKIKPVAPKKSSSWSWTGRRKRDTAGQLSSIVLTCFRSDDCAWKTDSNENIQWSLARMPPSTQVVQSGYFYVSNRNNYGDLSKMLRITLNQTDSATIADQNSDHCIELALYVTERAQLNLFRLTKTDEGPDSWRKGNLLMSWSPTLVVDVVLGERTTVRRSSLPNSHLFSIGAGQGGWTLETLCFGDFFGSSPKECGSSKCAFGFEMEIDPSKQSLALPAGMMYLQEPNIDLSSVDLTSSTADSLVEQVVGVSLLNEYTVNVPLKQSKLNWLDTWQRDEVMPGDNWKLYPKMDYAIETNQVRLLNLYDGAQYFVESDWININEHLDFAATLVVYLNAPNATNITRVEPANAGFQGLDSPLDEVNIFSLKTASKLVDSNFDHIYSSNSSIDWKDGDTDNVTLFNLGFSVSDRIRSGRNGILKLDNNDNLFKIVLEFKLDTHWLKPGSIADRFLGTNQISFNLTLANVSLSDRCHPNPCQFGTCQQNGTGYEDWKCTCDEKHRGRRCEFGKWCDIAHVTPWIPSLVNGKDQQVLTIKAPAQQRQPKLALESITRVSGREYCQRKLGPGFKCTNIDLPLNDNLYTEEDKTFFCTCQDDFYLSDDSKCKQAHLCNSIVCPSIGMICDETKPFNKTQPCQCNDKKDWYPDPADANKCIRRQCHDKQRDCGFDAHICLPTLPGERPICKCGPNFTLKSDEKNQKYCQSTACILPTLNDCEQVCMPDNSNLQRPYTCACHPGYTLDTDGKSCKPRKAIQCRPACHAETQICTELGCKCKQGYIGESEVIEQQVPKNRQLLANSTTTISYVKSVKCLNVCSLSYAENKAEFEMIESVCPLGLCDPSNFHCRCADPSSSALINTKYEPIYTNSSSDEEGDRERASPLCHLRRVCQPDSSSYQICKSQGAICVPDYTKAAMFDCICPPSTEKKFYGSGTSGEFTCEPKCGSKKYDCLRKQAVCKLIDQDQVKCECLPGLMFDQHDQRCYLAKYSYSFNLLIANRYYKPESQFHKLEQIVDNSTTKGTKLYEKQSGDSNGDDALELPDKTAINEIVPQFTSARKPNLKSIFIADYNQCNITQVIPKAVIEDPYEHDIESFLGYIEQCNERLHQTTRTYHLNSKLSEDLRQSLRQHLRDFTVTTSNGSCSETDSTGMYLNCTVYLQSNEPVSLTTVESVFNECDKHGQDERFCWIKPRLLLKKQQVDSNLASPEANQTQMISLRQVVPCEIDNFCGLDAYSVRRDDKSSLCSCKCPPDIEVIDVKDLEQRRRDEDPTKVSVKEICAPRNLCGANSTFCQIKTGSVCQYDIRLGSRCNCVYPSYEDNQGQCVEVAFNPLHNYLIVIIILLASSLLVSVAVNLFAIFKSRSLFGRSKQYPLNEFTTPSSRQANLNRSTGVPNLSFTSED